MLANMRANVDNGAVQAAVLPGAVQAAVLPGAMQAAARADLKVHAPVNVESGGFLLAAVVVVIGIINAFVQSPAGAVAFSVVAVSFYLLHVQRSGHNREVGSLDPTEVVSLRAENVDLRARVDGLAEKVEALQTKSRCLSIASWHQRDLHYRSVRIIAPDRGGAVALEHAEDRMRGNPCFDPHVNLDDPRCQWIIVPVGERTLYDCGVGCVRLMKAPIVSKKCDIKKEYKGHGKRCIDHGGNPIHMWDAATTDKDNSSHQGWRMMHSDGKVAFQAANKDTYLGIDEKNQKLFLKDAPVFFQLEIVDE